MKSDLSKKYELFQRLLVQAREDAGLSQQDVAEKLGRPQSYVSKCELGKRRMDVVEFLEIAQAVGFNPVDFVRKLSSGKVRH